VVAVAPMVEEEQQRPWFGAHKEIKVWGGEREEKRGEMDRGLDLRGCLVPGVQSFGVSYRVLYRVSHGMFGH
jgi:hypothetical protein